MGTLALLQLFHTLLLFQCLSTSGSVTLTKWLKDAIINIPAGLPPISVDLHFGYHLQIGIDGGSCHGLSLTDVRVTRASFEDQALSINLAVEGFGFSCHIVGNASLKRKEVFLGTGPISIDAQVDNSKAEFGLRMPFSQTPQLPQRVDLSQWETAIHVSKLRFSGKTLAGRLIANTLDALRPVLMNGRILNSLTHDVVAKLIHGPLCKAVADWVQKVMASGVLEPAVMDPVPKLMRGVVDLKGLSSGTFSQVLNAVLVDEFHVHDKAEFSRVLHEVLNFLNLAPDFGQYLHFLMPTQLGQLSIYAYLPHCVGRASLLGNSSAYAIRGQMLAENVGCHTILNFSLVPSGFILMGDVLNVSVNVTALTGMLNFTSLLLLGLNQHQLNDEYQLDQVQHLGCLLQSIVPTMGSSPPGKALSILGLVGHATKLASVIQAHDMDPLIDQVSLVVSSILNIMLVAFQSALSMFLEGGGAAATRKFINDILTEKVSSPPPCPATNFSTGLFEPARDASQAVVGVGFLFSVVALLFSGAVRFQTWCRRGIGQPGAGRPQLNAEINSSGRPHLPSEIINSFPTPSMQQPCLSALSRTCSSRWTSYAVSFMTMGVIGLFLVSSTGMQVVLRATARWDASPDPHDQYANLKDLFDFTMWKVLDNFWNSKCYPLFFFVILWSIMWPIMKLVIMLWCWHAPAKWIHPTKRGPILTFLDQVGKFSLFDPFLFTMFLVGFRLSWQGDCSRSTCGLVMQAVPQIGFYFLFLGTVLSLGIGEIMLWYDRESQALQARYIAATTPRSRSASMVSSSRRTSRQFSSTCALTPIKSASMGDDSGALAFFVGDSVSSVVTPSHRSSRADGGLAWMSPLLTGTLSVAEEQDDVAAEASSSSAEPFVASPSRVAVPTRGQFYGTPPCSFPGCGEPAFDARLGPCISHRFNPQGQSLMPTLCMLQDAVECAAPLYRIVEARLEVRVAIWILVCGTFASTVLAVFAKSYAYDWAGVIGAFKLVIHDPLEVQFSILDLLFGVLWPYDDTLASKVAVCFLFTTIGFFVVLAPCIYVTLLLILWAFPLTPKRQYQCFVWVQIINAWSAMDVFVISVFVSMFGGDNFGIGSFIKFIVEHGNAQPVCDMLKDSIGVQCIVFKPRLLWGTYVLAFAAVLQVVTGQIVYRQVRHVLSLQDT